MYHRDGPEGAIVARMIRDPLTLRPRADTETDQMFVAFVNRCIAVEPADRPSVAEACAAELMRLLEQVESK